MEIGNEDSYSAKVIGFAGSNLVFYLVNRTCDSLYNLVIVLNFIAH